MAAPTGNKNAEKWNRERTLQYLEHITDNVSESNVFFLGEALLSVGLYNDIWAYWKEKWEDDEEIIDRMKYIMQCFEVKLFRAAAMRQIHAGVAIFALKVHYGWLVPKPEKEKPAAAQPAYAAPAPAPQAEVIEKEPVKKEVPATLPPEKTETASQMIETVKDLSTTDIGHHTEVLLAHTGS